jgi:hypothetical protein
MVPRNDYVSILGIKRRCYFCDHQGFSCCLNLSDARVDTPAPNVLSSKSELVCHTSFDVLSYYSGQVCERGYIASERCPDLALSA